MAEEFANDKGEGAYDETLVLRSTPSSHSLYIQNAGGTTYLTGSVDQSPANSSNTGRDERIGVQHLNIRQEVRDIHPPVELAHHTDNNFTLQTSGSIEHFHADAADEGITSHSVAERHQQYLEQNVGAISSQSAFQEMASSNEGYNYHLGVNTVDILSSTNPQHNILEHQNSIMNQQHYRMERQAANNLQDAERRYQDTLEQQRIAFARQRVNRSRHLIYPHFPFLNITSLTPTDNINKFITKVQDSNGHTFDFDYIRCIVKYNSCSASIIRYNLSSTEISEYVLKVLINGAVLHKLGKNIKDLTIQAIRDGFDLFLSTTIEEERCIKKSSFTVLFCVLQLFVESVDRLTAPSSHTNVEDFSINIGIIEELLKFIQNCNTFLFRQMEIFNTDDNMKYALIEVIESTKKLFFRLAVTVHEFGRDFPSVFQEPIIPFPSLRLRQEPPILDFEEVAAVWKKVDELPDNLDDLCKEGDRCNICYEEDSKELAILDSCSHKICLTCARKWITTAR